MPPWNPLSASDWASRFGLVPVPFFSLQTAQPQGEHSVLLDGASGSLTFSRGSPAELLRGNRLLGWAWSANIPNTILVDDERSQLWTMRWDHPGDVQEMPIPDEHEASALLSHLRNVEPASADSSIDRAIDIFRAVRRTVSEDGGSDLDAIDAFNVLLAWAELRSMGKVQKTHDDFETIASHLAGINLLPDRQRPFSATLRSLGVGDLTEDLLYHVGEYELDAALLLRHASGILFQEAHIDLGRPVSHTRRLFAILRLGLPRPTGRHKSDAHYTPPPLARYLTDAAIAELSRLNPHLDSVRVLDPACGSGVFLIEAIRALGDPSDSLKLRGIDSSEPSCAIAVYAVTSAARYRDYPSQPVSVEIQLDDSLLQSWSEPDIILMNPPFLPWRSIATETRRTIVAAAQEFYSGHSDTAIAFLAKAASQLRPGAVLASVIPAAILQSDAARQFRQAITQSGRFNLCEVGRFRDYGYFPNATVEPAYVVISRIAHSSQRTGCRMVWADSGSADVALTGARITPRDGALQGDGWEVSWLAEPPVADWTPRPTRAFGLLADLKATPFVKNVTELFDVFLGVRTGRNPAFQLAAAAYDLLPISERSLFIPIADEIRRCRIHPGDYLFYPYDRDGKLLLSTENELKLSVPVFLETHLAHHRDALINRNSKRDRQWWEPSEPRTTWMSERPRKLVTTTFGWRGSFAYDRDGEFAVVQGNAWIWRKGRISDNLAFAYLALLNSPIWEGMLDYYCPRQQGGQYELARRFLARMPLPDLSVRGNRTVGKLEEFGRAMDSGRVVPLRSVDNSVAAAFGISLESLEAAFPLVSRSAMERDFQQLSGRWKHETEFLSSDAQIAHHPAYQQILAMGEAAIELILRDLERRPNSWFAALQEMTGINPVPVEHRGSLKQSVRAWMEWGRANGYDV